MGRVAVRVRPRARGDTIAGVRQGALVVRVSAPPVAGRANAALCRLIAGRLGVAPSLVRVVRGATSRDKLVEVEGLADGDLRRALGLPSDP
jgi:uncharacterized protein